MNRRQQGFTLIELLIVIGIIAVLAAILIPTFRGAQEKPYDVAAVQCGRAIVQAATVYRAEHGRFPDAPHSPDFYGQDVREVCTGIRVMPYAPPTSRAGSEYSVQGYNGAPIFFVAHPNGSGVYVHNIADTYCGASGCRLFYLRWSSYGL